MMWSAGRSVLLASYLCCLSALSFLLSIQPSADGWPTAKILASVVRITIASDGTPMRCSAFAVAGGRFVTATHCTEGAITYGLLPMDVLESDTTEDLALLQLRNGGSLPALTLGREPKVGDALLSVGYPLSFPNPIVIPSMFQGVFDGFDDGSNYAIFVGNSIPGMSGGPIVDTRGDVVSVILGGGNPSMVYQNMAFGARYVALRKLLLKWREN